MPEDRFCTLVDSWPDTRPCWKCGNLTRFLDVAFEIRLCKDCYDIVWNQYFQVQMDNTFIYESCSPDTAHPYPF